MDGRCPSALLKRGGRTSESGIEYSSRGCSRCSERWNLTFIFFHWGRNTPFTAKNLRWRADSLYPAPRDCRHIEVNDVQANLAGYGIGFALSFVLNEHWM